MQIQKNPTINPTNSKPRPLLTLLASVVVILLTFATSLVSTSVASAAAGPNRGEFLEDFTDPPIGDEGGSGGNPPPSTRPTAAIALGDSFVSGEGAEDYDDVGGRGEPALYGSFNNSTFWCHRSPNASIEVATLPGIDARFNLACSGGKPEHIDGPSTRIDSNGNNLVSQLDQLEDVNATHDIDLIMIGIGSNQTYPNNKPVQTFGGIIATCARKFLNSAYHHWTKRCDTTNIPTEYDLDVTGRTANANAIQAVLDRMDQLGYAPGDFRLVVQNYTNPMGENFHPDFHTGVWPTYNSDSASTFWGLYKERYKAGCPVHLSSNALGHQFSDRMNVMVEDAARDVLTDAQHDGHDVAFLDVGDAFDGDRICENAGSADTALAAPFRARTVNGNMMNKIGALTPVYASAVLLGCVAHIQLCQESLHPNAAGHDVLGDCLEAAWTSATNSRIDCRRVNGQTQPTATPNWIAPDNPDVSFDVTSTVTCWNNAICNVDGTYEMTRHKPLIGKGGTITNTVSLSVGSTGLGASNTPDPDGMSGTFTATFVCPGPAKLTFTGKSTKTFATGSHSVGDSQTESFALPC